MNETEVLGVGPSRSVRFPFRVGLSVDRVRGGRAVGRCGWVATRTKGADVGPMWASFRLG